MPALDATPARNDAAPRARRGWTARPAFLRGRLAAVAALCLALVGTAQAQSRKLQVGDPAPGLDVQKWINGDAVTIQPGKFYIVEFWSPGNAASKRAIPRLNDLQAKYGGRGLTVLAVTNDKEDAVTKFVALQGDRMSFLVAVDRKGATERAWLKAADREKLPCAFVIDRTGKIAFIGSPLEAEFERVIPLVVAGRYDPKKEAAARPVLEAAERAAKVKNWRLAYKHLDEVVAMDPTIFVEAARRKFEIMLTEEQNPEKAYEYMAELMKTYASDPGALRIFASDLALNPKYEQPNLDVALALAQAALQVSGANDPDSLAMVALVQFHRGELQEAVERQMQAWMIAPPAEKPAYRRVLDNYRSAAERTAARKP